MNAACMTAQALTYDPFRQHLFLPQFTVHLMETFHCIRYAVSHFKIITKSPINHEYQGCKLQNNGVSRP